MDVNYGSTSELRQKLSVVQRHPDYSFNGTRRIGLDRWALWSIFFGVEFVLFASSLDHRTGICRKALATHHTSAMHRATGLSKQSLKQFAFPESAR